MKIIKIITDVEKSGNQLSIDWALGDDGELYWRFNSSRHDPDEVEKRWWRYTNSPPTHTLTFREMKKIVEAFGLLMAFL